MAHSPASVPHVQMDGVFRAVIEELGYEVPDVETEDFELSHRDVPPRRCVKVTVVAELHLADRQQPPADVRVFSMELDGRVESANTLERVPAHREITAVEDRADTQEVFDEQLSHGR